ncbi:monofunctional biosynthetic peptidoglycan transglycosylase [Epibacterium ulvae]|uniref:monofunctional biosynthetic peptidoglycan transglycosylase n=1 Tax=Epibacterium ulvae TaxID=1156985 RepID=UPI001BFC9A64|nr:monofunctional biosynthetic peptidoglycan transglycosylase [Epibacterium ulvae]MBT8155861.1 monofunctional biosynthetic peptidoglycan transglycosylase [Epibacterium ulvae]
MASRAKSTKTSAKSKTGKRRFRPIAWLRRWILRSLLIAIATVTSLALLYSVVNPPITHTIWSEKRRLGDVDREWVPIEHISPVLVRSVVAAEDANYCLHWGFDLEAIQSALQDGGQRGGSSLSQQVVKNVFLWQHRSWFRKALETLLTPMVEAVWTKRRILEVYLNVAETDEGVFGVEAGARRYFGKGPDELSAREASLLAAVLPNPKGRSAAKPTAGLVKRAARIADGAATIRADGRSACFED